MADKELPQEVPPPPPSEIPPETGKVVPGLANLSAAERPAAEETILALYYSGDIYVQMCFWLAYILVILCVAVWLSWRLFGREVSEILLMQGGQMAEKPDEESRDRRWSDSWPGIQNSCQSAKTGMDECRVVISHVSPIPSIDFTSQFSPEEPDSAVSIEENLALGNT